MTISPDTNVLVRMVARDDLAQAQAADNLMGQASKIVISVTSLAEFVWVLRYTYGFSREITSLAIQTLLNVGNVLVDRPAADAGLAALSAGRDFADGVYRIRRPVAGSGSVRILRQEGAQGARATRLPDPAAQLEPRLHKPSPLPAGPFRLHRSRPFAACCFPPAAVPV